MVFACGCTSTREWWYNGWKVGPNYGRPPAPVAEEWIDNADVRVRSESADHSDWWTVFDDPLLSTLVHNAYRQNLPLRVAGFRVLEARAQRAIAAGNLLPQSQQALADYARLKKADRLGTSAPGQSFGVWGAGFNLAWELDFWGRFRRAVEAADADLNASVENYDDVLVTLVADVAETYIEIRTCQQRLVVTRANIEAQRGSLQLAETRFKNGKTTIVDVQQAKANLARTESHILPLEIHLRQAGNRMCILCGIPPRNLQQELGEAAIPNVPTDVVVGIPAELMRRRPDVRRAERQLAAQSARIGIATAELYPHIAITGTIGIEANYFADLYRSAATTGAIGPSLRWNILNYGRLLNNIRVHDARFQELAATYQNSVLRANEEVENALVSFLRSQEEVRLLSDSATAAADAVRTTMTQYREGKVDFNRVFDLQIFLAQQQDLQVQSSGNVAKSLIEVYRALGGGWQIRYSTAPTAATEPIPAPAAPVLPPPAMIPSPPTSPIQNPEEMRDR
ncbi:MAG: efflux transporter outer membrane subunit [Pirellulales bacterium]|nr:efflux transporter outer membrane subunit [Pirellulales bacterium]